MAEDSSKDWKAQVNQADPGFIPALHGLQALLKNLLIQKQTTELKRILLMLSRKIGANIY